MRYTWCSAKARRTQALSVTALARLRPNGFSTITRVHGRCLGSGTRGAIPDSASRLIASS
jgi:hypothetical protein